MNTPISATQASETPTVSRPDFSIETLLNAVDNDHEFAAELLELFLMQTPDQLQAIRLAQETNDAVSIGRIIHAQKAPFPVFGLTEVARAGRVVEARIAATTDAQELAPLVDHYVTALDAELPLMRAALVSLSQ